MTQNHQKHNQSAMMEDKFLCRVEYAAAPCDRRPALGEGLEQLAIWINYDDSNKHLMLKFLKDASIKPFFCEYERDYLVPTKPNENIECDQLFEWLCEKNAFLQPKYYTNDDANLSKKGWVALDHAARFVVSILRFSWDNNGEWNHGHFDPLSDESDLEYYQAWAILRYLHAEWQAAHLVEWDAECLTDSLGTMSVEE